MRGTDLREIHVDQRALWLKVVSPHWPVIRSDFRSRYHVENLLISLMITLQIFEC